MINLLGLGNLTTTAMSKEQLKEDVDTESIDGGSRPLYMLGHVTGEGRPSISSQEPKGDQKNLGLGRRGKGAKLEPQRIQ
jgi:hypothetical protein